MIYANTDKEIMDEIKKKAIEIFAAKGYAATKISDIADSLSISRGPIYYYFQDKFGLYTSAYDHFESELMKIHNEIFSTGDDFQTKIERLIFEFSKHISLFGHNFFFRIKEIPELHDINVRYEKMNALFYEEKCALIREEQRNGTLSTSLSPDEIVKGVYLIYLGILEALNSELLARDQEEEIKDWIHLLFEGLHKKMKSN
ncbi:TetR/AcrR family transcriptional regulator [Proteiniclasticum ruminis]|uniref:TetR/AcrR family transcriptional regulator n=1 Tax=Proteiniclasticum ruminis TaxID=398199 RepID=UPI0028B2020B|nr:TetR/AcrR family transcriptional regulator [Proteiniclasticum ruminis]